MQIIPTSLASAVLSSDTPSGNDDLGFSKLFSRVMGDNPAQVTPTLNEAFPHGEPGMPDSNAYAVIGSDVDAFATRSPYIKATSTLNSRFVQEEIRFTPDEVRKIAAGLQEAGMDPAVINAVLGMAENPMGVTTPDILKAVANAVKKPAQITDTDLEKVSAFLKRLDPEGTLADDVVADILAGRTQEGWQRIITALQSLDPDSALDVSSDEVIALGKSFGASPAALDALQKSFGQFSELKFTPNGFEKMMMPVQHELGEQKKQLDMLAASFEKVLAPVTQEARMRIKTEDAAAGRVARSVEQAKVLIQDTVTKNGLTRQDEPHDAKTDSVASKNADEASGKKSTISTKNEQGEAVTDKKQAATGEEAKIAARNAERVPRDAEKAQGAATLKNESSEKPLTPAQLEAAVRQQGRDAKGASESKDQPLPDEKRQGTPAAHYTEAEKKTERTSGWDSLINRIQYQERGETQMVSAEAMPAQTAQQLAKPAPVLPNYAPQVLKQVEQGILSGTKNGMQRLELQLTPENLGTVTVVLTTRNGEISAVLRPERAETAALMNQQTDQLRFVLEQQGLKVDKVEVQTQMDDGRNTMHWQGMDQHNASQEQQSRANDQQRILRLGHLHRGGSGDSALEHNVHNGMQDMRDGENLSERSLHIIT